MTSLPFPEWLDNTALTDFRACEMKSYWSTFRQIEPAETNVHLHAGAAFARALEAGRRAFYIEGKSSEDALHIAILTLWRAYGDYECPPTEKKTAIGMTYAVLHYWKIWPPDSDHVQPILFAGKRGIEFSFSVPIEINHPVTGNPLLLTGRADMMAEYKKTYWVEDDKTTKGIGPTWTAQWRLRSQFLQYTWAGRFFGHKFQGAIVRGISIQVRENKDAESMNPYPQHLLDRWYKTTLRTIKDMIRAWENDDWRYDFAHSCTAYSGCPYARLCEAKDPEKWMHLYKKRTWDPLNAPDDQPVIEVENSYR